MRSYRHLSRLILRNLSLVLIYSGLQTARMKDDPVAIEELNTDVQRKLVRFEQHRDISKTTSLLEVLIILNALLAISSLLIINASNATLALGGIAFALFLLGIANFIFARMRQGEVLYLYKLISVMSVYHVDPRLPSDIRHERAAVATAIDRSLRRQKYEMVGVKFAFLWLGMPATVAGFCVLMAELIVYCVDGINIFALWVFVAVVLADIALFCAGCVWIGMSGSMFYSLRRCCGGRGRNKTTRDESEDSS